MFELQIMWWLRSLHDVQIKMKIYSSFRNVGHWENTLRSKLQRGKRKSHGSVHRKEKEGKRPGLYKQLYKQSCWGN